MIYHFPLYSSISTVSVWTICLEKPEFFWFADVSGPHEHREVGNWGYSTWEVASCATFKKHQGLVTNSQKHRYHVTLTSQEWFRTPRCTPKNWPFREVPLVLGFEFHLSEWLNADDGSFKLIHSSPFHLHGHKMQMTESDTSRAAHLACLENPKKRQGPRYGCFQK